VSNSKPDQPAFPITNPYYSTGMTLRDYFASQALAGAISNPVWDGVKTKTIAEDCYVMADAMMEARK